MLLRIIEDERLVKMVVFWWHSVGNSGLVFLLSCSVVYKLVVLPDFSATFYTISAHSS